MDGKGRRKWAVFTIRERAGLEKPIWLRIGIAFMNRDGSFSLYLDAQPLEGKLHMREWREEASPGATNGAATNGASTNGTTETLQAAAEPAAF